MKTIQNVPIWSNGVSSNVNQFELKIVNDNLYDTCILYYQLLKDGEKIIDGNITIDGYDYKSWNGSNNDIYTICANKLNLIIINN